MDTMLNSAIKRIEVFSFRKNLSNKKARKGKNISPVRIRTAIKGFFLFLDCVFSITGPLIVKYC